MDRTVIGACILAATLFIEFYIWDSYFSSFLQVVNNLSVTKASYVVNIYSIGSCFWALVVGVLIRWTGRFKWLALYLGVPVTILGVGLMIKFRQPDENVGFIVMCQIFIAFAGGTLVICEQIAVMAATSHQYIAVILAVESMFSSIGGAIGATIAGAIWTGTFPKKLAEYLPADAQADLTEIYESLDVQLSYEYGSETRNAIARAYGDSQRYMLISSTAILVVALVAVAVWRDIKVTDFKQTKGRVV
jgi:MFS family permease